MGLVDLPTARRQPPMLLDPAALDGHLLVVGAPQTGKSTALAAYATQAARLYPAPLLQFHVIDLGGGALAPLAALPNVGAYADGQDPDAVRRVMSALERLVDDQPRRLRRHGARSLADWRGLVAGGDVPGPAHTVLLLDQLASFRERFADLDAAFGRIVVEGPSAGVHVAVTSSRWAELPAKRLEQISARVELRLNDIVESQHGRAAAGSVPAGVPGRGLLVNGAVVQLAAPGEPTAPGDLPAAVRASTTLAQARWPGVAAPRLRRLADLSPSEWAAAHHEAGRSRRLLLGIDESGFESVAVELGAGVALLCYGDAGSGRSRFLARLLAAAAALPDPARPQVYVLDYLGSLLDRCADTGAVAAAAYGPQDTPDVLRPLTDELIRRQAGLAQARRERVPARAGRPLWLVADDYELVHVAARLGLVSELADLVPYAARLGFGLVVNQAANGSGARVDPLIRRLLEGGPWHLRFAVESRLELLLTGTRGSPLPAGQAVLTRPGHADALLSVLPPVAEPLHAQEPLDGDDPPGAVGQRIRLVS